MMTAATAYPCPAGDCSYSGRSERSVSTHWMHKHGGPCPLTTTQKTCVGCGATFVASNAMLRHRAIDYCSRSCWKRHVTAVAAEQKATRRAARQRPTRVIEVPCAHCGHVFRAIRYRLDRGRRFCSHKCASAAKDEGKTPLQERYRDRENATGWRAAVFLRDDFTCQVCQERGGELHAHHRIPVAEIVAQLSDESAIEAHPLFGDVSNGETRCVECHRAGHHG